MLKSMAKSVLLVATVAMFGCTPAVRSTSFARFPPRPPEHTIQVFSTKTPECAYDEVGLVTARQRYKLFVSMDDVLEALKNQARGMGGDAVLGVSQGAEASGGMVTENAVSIGSDPVLSGTVIRFVNADCSW